MRVFGPLALLLVYVPLFAQTPANSPVEPKSSAEWFIRARDRVTLRMPGSAAFHLTVKFHAYAGQEMLAPKEKSSFITGEGTYEEVWLEPHKWRREVTLADYHAVEVDANGVRKMHASSDYEPSRVIMLLDSLFTPIPRVLTAKELHAGSGWKIDRVSSGNISLVRFSKTAGNSKANFTSSYYFEPVLGVLVMSNAQGLVTLWSNDGLFDGKIVSKRLSIKAGERELLTADISIEAAGQIDPARLELPGGPAEPGMTLRPLHPNEIRVPDLSESFSFISFEIGRAPAFSMLGTLDRHGSFRELEILVAPSSKDASIIISHFRGMHQKSATIDGSACQFGMHWLVM